MNILLITTDQQHFRMMGCAGDPYVETPNLDLLAASGRRFLHAYSPNPVCVPCRYSFLTGRMPHVFGGLETNLKGGGEGEGVRPRITDWIDTPCIGHLVRSAGYDTVCGGKLHVEGPYNYRPEDESTYGFRCLTPDPGDGLATVCASFLGQRHDKPFFLWASFDQPHDICKFTHPKFVREQREGIQPVPLPANFAPSVNEGTWMKGFREGTLGTEKTIELGLNRVYSHATQSFSQDDWEQYRGAYRKWVKQADRQIGTVLDALDAAGLRDSTVVIFTSDHGDHDGAHGLTMKRSFYEESVHIPLIISHPGQVEAGSVENHHLVSNGPDLLPTLCDYAGVSVPAGIRGTTLRPAAEGRATEPPREYVVSETVGGRMVRTGRYKYCLYCCEGTAEELLFDMDSDPGETINIASDRQNRDTITQCREILAQWAKEEKDSKGKQYLSLI